MTDGMPVTGTVAVWDVPLRAEWLAAAVPLLDQAERARAAAFRFERDRRAWTVARAALRAVLAGCLGTTATSVRFISGMHGKPLVAGGSGPHFSLSHARDRALVAVSGDGPLGVDLEPFDRAGELLDMRDSICNPADSVAPQDIAEGVSRSSLNGNCIPPDGNGRSIKRSGNQEFECFPFPEFLSSRLDCQGRRDIGASEGETRDGNLGAELLRIWTAKEAYLKAIGVGLGLPPSDVAIRGTEPAQAEITRGEGGQPDPRFRIEWLPQLAAEGYSAAVAAVRAVKTIVVLPFPGFHS